MATLTVMSWNLQSFGEGRGNIEPLCESIAHIIVNGGIDLFIALELASKTGSRALASIARACQNIANAPDSYKYMQVSNATGNDMYGFLIRDLSVISFCSGIPCDGPNIPKGTLGDPLGAMTQSTWTTYAPPQTRPNQVYSTARPALLAEPFVKSSGSRPCNADKSTFGGQTVANGGLAQGGGTRLPTVTVFALNPQDQQTRSYIGIVALHSAAARSKGNTLGGQQLKQLSGLDICQSYGVQKQDDLEIDAVTAQEIYIDGAWRALSNLLVIGDFNLDFEYTDPTRKQNKTEKDARAAYAAMTPDRWKAPGQQSAQPGTVGTHMDGAPPAQKDPKQVLFLSNYTLPLQLKAAINTENTLLGTLADYDEIVANGGNPKTFTSYSIDNIFFGGVQASSANRQQDGQYGTVGDLPNAILNGVVDITPLAIYYFGADVRSASQMSMFDDNPKPNLTDRDALIGSRLISDHLPICLQFTI